MLKAGGRGNRKKPSVSEGYFQKWKLEITIGVDQNQQDVG